MKGKIFIIFSILLASVFVSAASWPADSSGTELVSGLPSPYEPSGLAWDSESQKLYTISDEGIISRMNIDGSNVENWYVSGDLEGIAVVSGKVYVGIEYPFVMKEFDTSTGAFTGKSWTFSEVVGTSKMGMEGVAVAATSTGLRVYAGSQSDGKVSVYDIDPSVSESMSYVGSFTPYSGSLSDLSYDAQTGRLYALYDNKLFEMDSDGNVLAEYDVEGSDQEGVVVISSCPSSTGSIVIASDTSASIMRYDNFAVSCPAVEVVEEEEVVIDPNLVESFSISKGVVSVLYQDGHSNSFTPKKYGKIQAVLSSDATKLIVGNGKYLAVYENGVELSHVRIPKGLKNYTLSLSGDEILVEFALGRYQYSVLFTLDEDTLVLESVQRTRR
ncbi:MAG: SdiA-regulated domain-containing protein [bacterium]|nr:SdiA-regulated domain-containing protein [bacterium]